MRSPITTSIIIIVVFVPSIAARVAAQCEVGWSTPIELDWPEQTPYGSVIFDEDGSGPRLPKTLLSGYVANGLIAWDGTSWSSFPAGVNPIDSIRSMVVLDPDGAGPDLPELWVGGPITSIGGIAVGSVARYDHGAWHGIADGIPPFPYGSLRKLIVLDADGDGPIPSTLLAMGTLIAELSGGSWNVLGDSNPDSFTELDMIAADMDGPGPEGVSLIRAGGYAAEFPLGRVERFVAGQWQQLGENFDKRPTALAMYDSDQAGPRPAELHVGGLFANVGASPIRALARWRDGAWQALEIQLEGSAPGVGKLGTGDLDGTGPKRPSLFVTGLFDVPGAPEAARKDLGRWDGQSWEGMGRPNTNSGNVFSCELLVKNERVFRWHVYTNDGVYFRDERRWRRGTITLQSPQVTAVNSLDLDGPGPALNRLVVGGLRLEAITDGVADDAAVFDGTTWESLSSTPLVGTIKDFEVFDFDDNGPMPPRLLATGRLTFAGNNYAVAVLEDGVWHPLGNCLLGSNPFEQGRKLIDFVGQQAPTVGHTLLLGGNIWSLSGNPTLAYLVRWDNVEGWVSAGSSINSNVTDMVVQDDDGPGPLHPALYVAAPMNAGAFNYGGIARWDGQSWSPLVDVTNGDVTTPNPVNALCSLEEEPGRFTLCAGGNFNTSDGLKYAARWKHGHWMPMGAALTGSVTNMISHDGGPGDPAGKQVFCCRSSATYRWNGQDWVRLTFGQFSVNSFASIDFDVDGPRASQLVAGGPFFSIAVTPTENLSAHGIATWGPKQPIFRATPWDRSIAVADRLSLKVATGGPEPMTFAWTRDGVPMVDGGAVSGATTRELVIDPVAFGDSGQYECTATNACGAIPSGPTLVRVCAALANGDVNADGHVDGLDIPPFVALWTSSPTPASDCAIDLTHNGVRDPDDLGWFIGRLLSP